MSVAKRFKRETIVEESRETLIEIEQFKRELNEYDEFLAQIEKGYKYPKEFIYDECNELRRRMQLDIEETITLVKDESELDADLIDLIESIKNQSSCMIDKVDKHEKEASLFFENNKPNKKKQTRELAKSKNVSKLFISKWKTYLADNDFDEN